MGHIFLSRAASILIAISIMLSTFSGLFVFVGGSEGQVLDSNPSGDGSGDWYIGEDYSQSTVSLRDWTLTGNLTIRSGGVVIIDGGSLTFSQQYTRDASGTESAKVYTLVIEDGGKLVLRNSTLTARLNNEKAFPSLGMIVRNQGVFEAYDSVIKASGHLVVDDSTFNLTRSVIMGNEDVSSYCNPLFFPSGAFDDSMVLLFMSSRVNLFDSRIEGIYEPPTGSVDMAQIYNHTYSFATDVNDALYNRLGVTYALNRMPSGSNDSTGQAFENITKDDLKMYEVGGGEWMWLDGFDTAGLMFGASDMVRMVLNVKYNTTPGFSSSSHVLYQYSNGAIEQTPMTFSATPVDPVDGEADQVVATATLPFMSAQDLYGLNLGFHNTDPSDSLFINKVWVSLEINMDTYRNVTVAGNSDFTSVNSYIGVDFSDDDDLHNQLVLMNNAMAYMYGSLIDETQEASSPASRQPAYVAVEEMFQATATDIGVNDTTSGQEVGFLTSRDLILYATNPSQIFEIEGFNTSDLRGSVTGLRFYVNYRTNIPYNPGGYIQWATNSGSLKNTNIMPASTLNPRTDSFDLYSAGVKTISDVESLHIYFNNGDATGSFEVDKIWLNITISPVFYIYRWANITAQDSQGLPVNDASVRSTVQSTGEEAYYYTSSGKQNYPSDAVLQYLGKDSTTFNVTNSDGFVQIPLLSEVKDSRSDNPYLVMNYLSELTYVNSTGFDYTAETGVAFDNYPNLNMSSMFQNQLIVLEDLLLDLPDLLVFSVNYTPTVVYDGNTAHIVVVVRNEGRTTATNVPVSIVGFRNGTTAIFFSNQTVASMPLGSDQILVADWSDIPYGTHTISVTIDPERRISEESRTNNEMSVSMVVLANLPDLSVVSSDISFNPQPATTSALVTATIIVRNVEGRAAAMSASVQLYAGNRDSGGQYIGFTNVTVPTGGSSTAVLSWRPTQVGTYPVYVYLNADHSIEEYDYTNNTAYHTITVTIVPDGSDLVVGGPAYPTLTIHGPNPFNWANNVTVLGNGVLTLDGSAFTLQQTGNYQLQIMVQGQGSLKLVNMSSLNAQYNIRLYLHDEGQLIVTGSNILSSVHIVADDSSTILMEKASVGSDIVAPLTSQAMLEAYNTTFAQAWSSFGGSAEAHVTNVSIPSLNPQDSAVIYHYRWLVAVILDGTGNPLPNTYVGLEHPVDGLYAEARSGQDGKVRIQALCDVLRPGVPAKFMGSYFINATYWYGGVPYHDQYTAADEEYGFSLQQYTAPLTKLTSTVVLPIPSALPDIDPPVIVSDETPARNQTITVGTVVSNLGVVPAYNVLVMFNDTGVPFHSYTIPVIQPGASVEVETTWTAGYPLGEHNITVVVDPFHTIIEMNERNNEGYKIVDVQGIADLVIGTTDIVVNPSAPVRMQTATVSATIRNQGDVSALDVAVHFSAIAPNGTELVLGNQYFDSIAAGDQVEAQISWTPEVAGNYTLVVMVESSSPDVSLANNGAYRFQAVLNFADLAAQYVTFTPASPVDVNQMVTMVASVRNRGDIPATNILVRFYLGDEVTGTVIGEAVIASLNPGEVKTASVVWKAMVREGLKVDSRVITAVVNPERLITEIDYTNNKATQQLTINEVRPDVLFPSTIDITNSGNPVNHSGVGETIVIETVAKNNGTTSAMGVEVAFYVVSEGNKTTILGSVFRDIGAGQSVVVNYTWRINVTMGNYTIVINANPDHAVEDSNTTNDQISVAFIVDPPNPNLQVNDPGTGSFVPGNTIAISGRVSNKITSDPISEVTVVAYIVKDGMKIGESFERQTDNNGNFVVSVYLPESLNGQYEIHVHVTVGDKVDSQVKVIQVKAAGETGVPWYIYLLILAIVMVVIVGFSAYLYKYGLGKMVECGECGVLIPESSRRCPKCGVEFEAGTAKCSECGAWIPSNSTSCPECNAKFITEAIEEEEDAYLKKMREQYEAYVDTFREEARRVLGKKYSDGKFPDWWKKQPSFISFEQWLSQEEDKRKGGSMNCPICGTPNPRGSTICHKCGSMLEARKPEVPFAPVEQKEEKPKPLRRIVRRPVEKKAPAKAEEEPKVEEEKAEAAPVEESMPEPEDKPEA